MNARARLLTFSIAAQAVYTLAFYFDWPVFFYAPQTAVFGWGAAPAASEPAIYWYGWVSAAAMAGLVAALVPPRSWLARIPADAPWLVSVLAIAATLAYERRWF